MSMFRPQSPLASILPFIRMSAMLPALLFFACPVVHAQPSCPLTPAQQQAVDDAVTKLWDLANGSMPWPDDDERWEPLARLVFTFGYGPFGSSLELGGPLIDSQDLSAAGGLAQTHPRNGRMDPAEDNDISLDKSSWQGADNDDFGASDPRAACGILSAALMHEGSHQDDAYPWPPKAGTGGYTAWLCAEIDAYDVERSVLDNAPDDELLSQAGLDEVNNRRAHLSSLQRRTQIEKEGGR